MLKGADGRLVWIAFSDPLVRYGSGIRKADLVEAYRKARVAFQGQLEKNFVVPHDGVVGSIGNGVFSGIASGANASTPRKQQR
jgi:hypothetical protein